MGNSVLGGSLPQFLGGAITKFYTPASWIEGRAEDQLKQVASWPDVRQVAAFPDLHPGKHGPVGCAVLAGRIFPQLIGNDIGCGMSLFALDLPVRKIKLDKAVRRLRVLGDAPELNAAEALEKAGLATDLFADALGTIGGGNHFCEVQTLASAAPELSYDNRMAFLLVHSGSRGFGNAVLNTLPQGAFEGLASDDPVAQSYLRDHDLAVRWASLNRAMIARRAAEALSCEATLLIDAPHNLLAQYGDGWLHRKGAAVADGGLVPLAGSRATPSYLMRPSGASAALASCAHGAGRRYDRSSMHGRVRAKKSDLAAMERTPLGGRVICEDRDLMIEEAPHAYKSAKAVATDLAATGAAETVATLHPLVTFKKTHEAGGSND